MKFLVVSFLIYCGLLMAILNWKGNFNCKWLFDITDSYTYKSIYFKTKQKELDDKIILLTLDDDTMRQLHTQSVPQRKYFATAINRLSNAGAKVIAIDIVFAGEKKDDKKLELALKKSKRVVLACYDTDKTSLTDNSTDSMTDIRVTSKINSLSNIPKYFYDNAKLGTIHVNSNIVIKDFPPYSYLLGGKYKIPGFFLKIMEVYTGEKSKIVRENKDIYIKVGEFKIPLVIRDDMPKIDVNYKCIEYNKFNNYFPFSFLISEGWDSLFTKKFVKDKIVFIIPASILSNDIKPAPYFKNAKQPLMYGGMLHANLVNQVLTNDYLVSIPIFNNRVIIFIFFLLFTALLYYLGFKFSFFIFVFSIIAYTYGSFYVFENYNIIGLNYILIDILLIISFIYSTLVKYIRMRRIRGIFKRYVGASVLSEIIKNKSTEEILKGKEVDLTVFILDVRGFTKLSEEIKPVEIVNILNDFFNLITKIILEFGGTIDKFMGDAVLAFFGAPIELKEKEKKAVLCAEKIANTIEKHEFHGKKLKIGIALTTGKVVVGNIGSENKMEYTIIGPAVNLASRIEGINKRYSTNIIMDRDTANKSDLKEKVIKIGEEKIRGVSGIKSLYSLKGEKNNEK